MSALTEDPTDRSRGIAPQEGAPQNPSLLIVHDFFVAFGGGERVSAAIATMLPDAAVMFSTIDRSRFENSPMSRLSNPIVDLGMPKGSRWLRTLGAIVGFLRASPRIAKTDVAIFSGSFSLFALLRGRPRHTLYYCNTSPRFAYDLYERYRSEMPAFARPLFALFVRVFRSLYARAIGRFDIIVANSVLVAKRLKEQLDIEAEVVTPPLMLNDVRWREDGETYLSLARLTSPKRVGLIVEAFRSMPERRLRVISDGPLADELKRSAAGAANIEFLGWRSDAELAELIGRCRATIYVPVDEDFGLSPIESMAAGKPAIVAASGSLVETIIDGETGLHVPEPVTPALIADAVRRLDSLDRKVLRERSERRAADFALARFEKRMFELLARLDRRIVAPSSSEPDSTRPR